MSTTIDPLLLYFIPTLFCVHSELAACAFHMARGRTPHHDALTPAPTPPSVCCDIREADSQAQLWAGHQLTQLHIPCPRRIERDTTQRLRCANLENPLPFSPPVCPTSVYEGTQPSADRHKHTGTYALDKPYSVRPRRSRASLDSYSVVPLRLQRAAPP